MGSRQRQQEADLLFLTGDLTSKDESTQELSSIYAAQICDAGGPCSYDNPIWIIDIAWDPRGDYREREIECVARGDLSESETDAFFLFTRDNGIGERQHDAPLPPGTFSFQVVPAPGALALAPALLLAAPRRRTR